MTMMNRTFENVQQFGKEWSAYSRRVGRDALRAMSGQLEHAARYLGSLSDRFENVAPADQGEKGENGAAQAGGHDDAKPHDTAN